jgi:hypothetical protein
MSTISRCDRVNPETLSATDLRAVALLPTPKRTRLLNVLDAPAARAWSTAE